MHVNRRLMVLDEPRSELAGRATEALFTYLRSLRDWNITSILVTHDPFDAYRAGDRFVVIARGEKVFEKTRAETSVDELIEKVSQDDPDMAKEASGMTVSGRGHPCPNMASHV